MWVLKGMTDFTGVPPFTIGSRILAPEFSIEDYLSRREKQKQQRMRADLCCVEELSVRLAYCVSRCLKGTKKPKGLDRLYGGDFGGAVPLLGLVAYKPKGASK